MTDPAECQSCGAMLPPPDAEGHVTCLSCGGRTRRSRLPPPPGDDDLGIAGTGAPHPVEHRPSDDASPGPGAGCVKGGIATFVVLTFVLPLLLVGCIVVTATWPRSGSGGGSAPPTTGSVIVLEATALTPSLEASGTTSVVALVQVTGGSGSDRHVVSLAVGGDGIREGWRSASLGRTAANMRVATIGESLAVVVSDRLLLLDRSTGERRWETRLSDVVSPTCSDCLLGIGSRIVVRTADGQVRAFAESSPEPRWSRTLDAANATMVRARAHLVIVDDPTDGAPFVESVDPATGESVGRAPTPCAARFTSMPTTVAAVPGQDAALLLAGYAGACAARFDAGSATIGPDLPLPDGLYLWAIDDDPPVFVGGEVTLPSRDSLSLLDLATGAVRTLPLPEGVTVRPTFAIDGTLLATTTASRGTPVGGVAAWDLASGRLRWSTRFDDRAQVLSLDPTFGDVVFPGSASATLGRDGDGATLITFAAGDSSTVSVAAIDLATGTVGPASDHRLEDARSGSSLRVSVIERGPFRLVFLVDWQLRGLGTSGSGAMVAYPS